MKPKDRLRKALRTPALEMTFECPQCKRRVIVRMSDPPAIMHDLPTCPRYDRVATLRDGTEYLREARKIEEQRTLN